MSDQRAVVAELAELAVRGERVVLASVVRVVGAAYRGVGARMLVRVDGTTVGMVSAGCLEADLVAHAERVRAGDAPALVTYDNGADEDLVWSLGLGCDGTVEVLLEPLAPARGASLAALLGRALAGDEPARLATVVRAEGAGAPDVGARVLVAPGNVPRCDGGWGDGVVLARVLADAAAPVPAPVPNTLDVGGVRVAVERVDPPVRLVVCGSGPDVVPVVRLAAGLGWDTTVVAPHAAPAGRADRFPGARTVACDDPARVADAVALAPHTAAVVMSHDYARDRAYVGALLDSPAGYVGVMGPRRRTDRMLADLAAAGRAWPAERFAALYAPVGLDVGGDGPDAIALAIVAEVSATAGGRAGGHLRERRAPIHAPREDARADAPAGAAGRTA
ncbi:xanthine dehydrogenase [Gemmatimonadetes bacterium T265]|nr:xanthine dehydrogenase [Gemmatimonadetes bacterium T265]